MHTELNSVSLKFFPGAKAEMGMVTANNETDSAASRMMHVGSVWLPKLECIGSVSLLTRVSDSQK